MSRTLESGIEGRLPDDQVRRGISGTRFTTARIERGIEPQHALVDNVGDEEIALGRNRQTAGPSPRNAERRRPNRRRCVRVAPCGGAEAVILPKNYVRGGVA